MKNNNDSAFLSNFKRKIKSIWISILKKYIEIVENHREKKNKNKQEENSVSPTSRQSINPYYEQNDVPNVRKPSSISDFKVKHYKKKHREIISVREKKAKKERTKKQIIRYIILALIGLLLLLALILGAVKFHSTMRPNDVEDTAKQFIEGTGRGKGYPYSINSLDVKDMQPMNTNLAVLTRDSFLILNSSAKEVVRYQHNYFDPAMYVYSSRALIYDKATGKFCVLNSGKVLLRGDLETEIYAGIMNKDGTLAFSVKKESAASELIILNARMEKKYVLDTKDEKVFDVAVSPNGKGAAVILTGSQNAELYSKLMIVDFSKKEPIHNIKYAGCVLLDVLYPNKNKVIAISNKFTTSIDKNGERHDNYKYGGLDLMFCDTANSNRSVVVLSQNSGDIEFKAAHFDSKLNLQYEKIFDEKIRAVSCSNKYVTLLMENRAVLLDNKGEIHKEFKTQKNGKRIVNVGNDVYILYSNNISKNS